MDGPHLGATQAATSSSDTAAYGDYYQWGRGTDGHEKSTSTTIVTQSSGDTPGHGDFIHSRSDWRNPHNRNLWQGVNGINNPCPSGYRVPILSELEGLGITDAATALSSPLKLPVGGFRDYVIGSPIYVGVNGLYWSSTDTGDFPAGTFASVLDFTSDGVFDGGYPFAIGIPVRCIKD